MYVESKIWIHMKKKKIEKHLTSISSAEYWRDNVYYNVQ
jgi:hypothetical protein